MLQLQSLLLIQVIGAVLVVDAAQGIEAQTLANVYLALDNNLEIIPVINKIDLPSADPERVRNEIEEVIGLDASDQQRVEKVFADELAYFLKRNNITKESSCLVVGLGNCWTS